MVLSIIILIIAVIMMIFNIVLICKFKSNKQPQNNIIDEDITSLMKKQYGNNITEYFRYNNTIFWAYSDDLNFIQKGRYNILNNIRSKIINKHIEKHSEPGNYVVTFIIDLADDSCKYSWTKVPEFKNVTHNTNINNVINKFDELLEK